MRNRRFSRAVPNNPVKKSSLFADALLSNLPFYHLRENGFTMTPTPQEVQDRPLEKIISDGRTDFGRSRISFRTDVPKDEKEAASTISDDVKERAEQRQEKLKKMEEETLEVILKGFRL